MTEVIGIKEIANHLEVTISTLHRLLWLGKLPATKTGDQWQFEKGSIDEWLGEQPIVKKASILVVDDEEMIRDLIRWIMEKRGHEVTLAVDGGEGLKLVEKQDYDMVFIDLKMPGMDGAELFSRIRMRKPYLPVVIITGYPGSDMMTRASHLGAFAVIEKPFEESKLIRAVDVFLKIGKLIR